MSLPQTTTHGEKSGGDQGRHSVNLLELEPAERDDESVCSCRTNTDNGQTVLQFQGTPYMQTLSASACENMEVDFYLKKGQVGNS